MDRFPRSHALCTTRGYCRYEEKDFHLEKYGYTEEALQAFGPDFHYWVPLEFATVPLGAVSS